MAQVIPLTPLSLGLTGDFDAVEKANNLCMVAINSRMQHERNHDDAWLATKKLTRLDIDPARVQFTWALDCCAQGLRQAWARAPSTVLRWTRASTSPWPPK